MRLRPALGWAVFIFLVTIIVQALPSPVGGYYFFQGQYFRRQGRPDEAAQAFEKSIASDPNFARSHIDLGSTYLDLEKYADAEKQFKEALSIKEDSCAACGLGAVYRQMKRNDEAESILKQAIKLSPTDSCAYNQLGRLYYDLEKYPQAADSFASLIKLDPTSVNYYFLAQSLYESGKTEDSIEYYRSAAKKDRSNYKLFIDLATAYYRLARYREAQASLEVAVALKPDSLKARSFLGVTYYMRGDIPAAMEQYHWVLGKDPQIAAEMLRGYKELGEKMNELQMKRQAPEKTIDGEDSKARS